MVASLGYGLACRLVDFVSEEKTGMKQADRYIAKAILSSMGLVTLVLVALEIFILFVTQLDKIGSGSYGMITAIQVVLLQVPYEVYLFFPMASLLGCLIGLGFMAHHRELLVLRTAGLSIGQIGLSVFKVAMAVVLLVTLLGEWFIPHALQYANNLKINALSGRQSVRLPQGIWLRSQHDFIRLGMLSADKHIHDVDQFHFDTNNRLTFSRHLDEVYYDHQTWWANDVKETQFSSGFTTVHTYQKMLWDVNINTHILLLTTIPDEMNLVDLYHYWHEMQLRHQAAHHEQWVFWQRVVQPWSTLVMMLLAIPFIFGPLRSSTMGSKLLIGASVGFGFYILNKLIGSLSLLYLWSPPLVTIAPTLVFFALGVFLMRRVI
jgi:lipopolysaccharide export system permease protein